MPPLQSHSFLLLLMELSKTLPNTIENRQNIQPISPILNICETITDMSMARAVSSVIPIIYPTTNTPNNISIPITITAIAADCILRVL